MAVDTVYENQDTISPRLNKQYTNVVNLGTVTALYDRWKEWLSEHADHIKTLGKYISPPPPFKLNLSVNHCQWETAASESEWSSLHSVSGELFSVYNQEIPVFLRYVWWWGPEEHASFLCVWRTGSIHDFLLGTLPEPATVIESKIFKTDLNTRDRQTSSNVCLLKL